MEAPKNESDARRLAQMADLIDANNKEEFLRLAYNLGVCQGRIDGMEQAREIFHQSKPS